MSSSVINYGVDDKDLDDDALWAVIDSIADAAAAASKYRNISQAHKHTPIRPILNPSNKLPQNPRTFHNDGEVSNYRPQKISRSNTMSPNSSIANQRSPAVTNYSSPEFNHSYNNSPIGSECSPATTFVSSGDGGIIRHSLAGPFPTVSLFKDYQNAAMAILERGDYTMISGSPFIKKTGWRKISFYFNLSYEIKDKTIEFDENRNVLRAEFIVRAHMQGARFSDGWGSCERREKKFLKPNHDIPSTAETRAKNKACQDLLGIGEYRPGVSQCRTSNS